MRVLGTVLLFLGSAAVGVLAGILGVLACVLVILGTGLICQAAARSGRWPSQPGRH